MKYQVTASIVTYHNNPKILQQVIDSFLNTALTVKLYIIDNSSTDTLKAFAVHDRVEYVFNGKNLGFGKAHNIALAKAVSESNYHVVLNPDIYFEGQTIDHIYTYMEGNAQVAQVMPKVLYPDGSVQFLCKLLPTPLDLFLRRFMPPSEKGEIRNRRYELQDSGYDKIMNIPYLSGCFMFLRTSALKEVGFFDERIFMYIEDADLTRRLHRRYQTIFYPAVTIFHHYAKGSYKSIKLMLYNIHGATVYFFKYGWFFDKERDQINAKVVATYLPKENHE